LISVIYSLFIRKKKSRSILHLFTEIPSTGIPYKVVILKSILRNILEASLFEVSTLPYLSRY